MPQSEITLTFRRWQLLFIGVLMSALVGMGTGAFVRIEARLDLLESRQLNVLNRLTAVETGFETMKVTDQIAIRERLRVEQRVDDIQRALMQPAQRPR